MCYRFGSIIYFKLNTCFVLLITNYITFNISVLLVPTTVVARKLQICRYVHNLKKKLHFSCKLNTLKWENDRKYIFRIMNIMC